MLEITSSSITASAEIETKFATEAESEIEEELSMKARFDIPSCVEVFSLKSFVQFA